ncbi:MAG: phosphoribosylglycinamide formyltransferase [Firmicutes bacterium]|nr:phosphoribosylglycinamide formyltransferase [Bacillota bacterium]MDD4263387.1 phosphoribosylglycinamide formyltransferase [Bacillota bacterium]MDD4694109.1 phosphoribosylglycinamide formyltransferase [Bacillota bacterium]
MKHLAVFASGSGSNYEAIENAFLDSNKEGCCVSLLVSDSPNAFVLERAKKFNRETFVFNPKNYENKEKYEKDILDRLIKHDIDLICLAGYMRIIGDTLLEAYQGRIINIHPALLPSFKGKNGIEDAFDYGVKVFGVTIHYVSKEVDGGKIIAQRAIEYYGNSLQELETYIHEIEHELYPETIKKLIKGN